MKDLLLKYIYCGQTFKEDEKRRIQYLLHNSFILIILISLLYFIISNHKSDATHIYYIIISAMVTNYTFLYFTQWIKLTVAIGSFAIILSLGYLIYFSPFGQGTFVWIMIIPFFIFTVNGPKVGLIFALFNIVVQSFALSHTLPPTGENYPKNFVTVIVALSAASLFMYLFEKNRHQNIDALAEAKQGLEQKIEKAIEEHNQDKQLMFQQSKMASMGEMMAAITHQWSQPLTTTFTILSNMEFTRMLGESIETLDDDIKSLKSQLTFMSTTMNDFKNFFKPGKQSSDFELHQGVKEIMKLFEKQYRLKNITIDDKINDTIIVNGFSSEYRQVILNILNNARDAILEREPKDSTIVINSYKEESYGVLTIEDYAGGVPESIIKTIFDPYVSTKVDNQGTGIGLYMSKDIIEGLMKGKLEVLNTLQGAKFFIKIPLKHT